MVEPEWRELLEFSRRELNVGDKEALCEALSWMEPDDHELGLHDLKTLFRLAQDILKYKSEQVNNLLGQLESTQRKNGKKKSKVPSDESPTRSSEAMETIAQQEELIKANKEILLQLQADIADLEARRNDGDRDAHERDSESSRGALSEMNAIEQLENEVTMKNRHIRKLLADVKVLEEENGQLKEKTSVLKDKLTEATRLIENLTEQLFTLNTESTKLKGLLGLAEEHKAQLTIEIESLRKELSEKDTDRDNEYGDIRSKLQHWKNIARSKKAENEMLSDENMRLKENLSQVAVSSASPKRGDIQEKHIKELQEKLAEASSEIIESAHLIETLKSDNKKLKISLKEIELHGSVSDLRNESDDGKERALINKLKKKVNDLTVALHGAEEMLTVREQELAEISSQLQLLQSGEEGLSAIFESLKSKKRQLKLKDEGIKSLVQEVNNLNQCIDDLQLENKALRSNLNISPDVTISKRGILKKYQEMEQNSMQLTKALQVMENRLISIEIERRDKNLTIGKLLKFLNAEGYSSAKIEELYGSGKYSLPTDGGGESSAAILQIKTKEKDEETKRKEDEMQAVIEENEGLRKGLQEIYDFLKDNSTSSSGILALQCPSLEAVLQSLEARHSAGWFAPHMAAILELKTAIGGRDALLIALHQARKETYDVVAQLSKESKKSQELEQKIIEMESISKNQDSEYREQNHFAFENLEFGTWMSGREQRLLDISDRNEIENIQSEGNACYENQLKNSLAYFHNKFKELFDKITTISIQLIDEQNKWSIQEEKYKAEIENLKTCLIQKEDDDRSEDSPGLIGVPSITVLQRKCSYLEESYKYMRTLNENFKNEYLESKKEAMILKAEYEIKIQKLIISIANITDKLRNSISLDIFWKQSEALNEFNSKYHKVIHKEVKKHVIASDMQDILKQDKMDIINTFQKMIDQKSICEENGHKQLLINVEHSILQKQIERLCAELETISKRLEDAENKNVDLQETQGKIIDKTISTATQGEIDVMKERFEKIVEENKVLKDRCQCVNSQLEIAVTQLQDTQQRQLSNDMEINMLRHQILDLQSVGDNKAVIARLSDEILVAHLQASESHKKIDRLNLALTNEIQRRDEAEEMLKARENIFNVYSQRYDSKFRYMYGVVQILRQQYQGFLPLTSIENYLNNIEDLSRKSHDVDEKLSEIEDLRSNLMIKHAVFDQMLDKAKGKCLEDEDRCPHELKLTVKQNIMTREKEYFLKKIQTLEQSRDKIVQHCNKIEKTLVLVNQVFSKSSADEAIEIKNNDTDFVPSLELEDVQSDEDSRRSQTITLPKPQLLKSPKHNINMSKVQKDDDTYSLPGSPVKVQTRHQKRIAETVNVLVQTTTEDFIKKNKIIQTDVDKEVIDLRKLLNDLQNDLDKRNDDITKAVFEARQKTEENLSLLTHKTNLEIITQNLRDSLDQKEKLIDRLQNQSMDLNKEFHRIKCELVSERSRYESETNNETKSLLQSLRKLEKDKNTIVNEYQAMLTKERDEYMKSVRDLNVKIIELKTQLDRKDSDASNTDAVKEVTNKYSVKTIELEDKCFKMQSELDSCRSEITRYQSEAERWKDLATERLSKMEQLNSQLEERHCNEMESYKAESQHWLSQLHEGQREQQELRSRLSDQKTQYMKQLAEKDALVDQLRNVVHNLKSQIMNMQTMMTINDPTFDLSAIVEVEDSEGGSGRGSDRLEIRFDSSSEIRDDMPMGMPAHSTALWQEPIIERLRREKQLMAKQNGILRRQIKALAARERRARLEAHNLKNQIYRISTSGCKVATAESVALQTKIASLQAQLTTARRDTQSNVALWDKWKRAQQASERWQAKYEEKSREVAKLESSLNLAKSSVTRLEREKRTLLSRLHDVKNDKPPWYEKQEYAAPHAPRSPVPSALVSSEALMDRVEAQQRRIAALELAEKGNEPLVSEYERALAELTNLRGQVLHLESALLEAQLRVPLKAAPDPQPELHYWKSYCDMLKDENMQLTAKVNSSESTPSSAHHHRVSDLEQTVLTLRGLVSKLQAEQKTTGCLKRTDSRLSSERSATDKSRGQLEPLRTEIANLKRSMAEKDNLLERSKEMLKIAAEREDELLRENAYLHQQIEELTRHRGGFLSA